MTSVSGAEGLEVPASTPAGPVLATPTGNGRYFAVVPLLLVPVAALLTPLTRVDCSLTRLSLLALLAVTTVTDLRERKIRNWATYPSLLWAIAINLAMSLLARIGGEGNGPSWIESARLMLGGVGLGDCLLGAAVSFFILFFITCFSGGGAGDVKLATAIGAYVGYDAALRVLAYSYIVGGITVMGYLVLSFGPVQLVWGLIWRVFHTVQTRGQGPALEPLDKPLRAPIPLAGFFAAGCLLELSGVLR